MQRARERVFELLVGILLPAAGLAFGSRLVRAVVAQPLKRGLDPHGCGDGGRLGAARAPRVLPCYAALCASAVLAHTAAAQMPAASDSMRLVSRMTAVHRARTSNDAPAWYALLSPAVRRVMTLDEFAVDLGMVGVRPLEPPPELRVTLERICQCQVIPEIPDAVRCVAVLKLTGGGPPSPEERWIEAWDLIDTEWYWIYGEPHAGNPPTEPPRCPGER